MARSLSSVAIASANAQNTSEVWLTLLTVSGTGMTTQRLVNNNVDIVSRGQTFMAFPFEIELPSEDPDSPNGARIRVDNVDRRLSQAIRGLTSPPTVTLEVILASQPDTVEVSFTGLTMRAVQFTDQDIRGELAYEGIFSEPVTVAIIPQRFPGLF